MDALEGCRVGAQCGSHTPVVVMAATCLQAILDRSETEQILISLSHAPVVLSPVSEKWSS